jgi:hypothetical protein
VFSKVEEEEEMVYVRRNNKASRLNKLFRSNPKKYRRMEDGISLNKW